MADENVSVEGVQTKNNKRTMQVEIHLSISVPSLPTLSRVISRVEQVPNVTSVRRRT
jgi:(p)ppGpp synthase/HD superfamily hydrolase